MWRTGAVSGIGLLAVLVAGAQLLVPRPQAQVAIGGHLYLFALTSGLHGPRRGIGAIQLQPVAGETVCSNGLQPGMVRIDAGLSPVGQAKAMIHETVHIALSCDGRDLPVDERIAQDVSDLFNSDEGPFIEKELRP